MRIAALVFGILGGVVGLVAAIFALGIGGFAAAFGAEGAGTVVGGGLAAVVLAALGIVGVRLPSAAQVPVPYFSSSPAWPVYWRLGSSGFLPRSSLGSAH